VNSVADTYDRSQHGTRLVVAQAVTGKAPGAAPDPSSKAAVETIYRRLSSTSAVGFFTKLSIKGNAQRLQSAFRAYHAGEASASSLEQLRERYDVMVQEIILLLQGKDPELAQYVFASREVLWVHLADDSKFQAL
jgi:hypothetical protein